MSRGEEPTSFLIKGAANPQMQSTHAMPPPGTSLPTHRLMKTKPPPKLSASSSMEAVPFIDTPILLEIDRPLSTDYHFDLLSQFGAGELSEGVRRKNPSLAHFPVGQPGLRCRHCKFKTFYFERMANMKAKCIAQVREHIKTCTYVPSDVKMRFVGKYDHSTMQRQLNNLEGGSLDRLLHRLWLRLYHDFSKRKEIAAIAQSTPLLDDYDSDDSLFSSSSGSSDGGNDIDEEDGKGEQYM